jgi:hypothetical protein
MKVTVKPSEKKQVIWFFFGGENGKEKRSVSVR